tara:strand:- start:18599 stop:19039 length:441 start_codon:yes stop_codon:yes gene_type:complete
MAFASNSGTIKRHWQNTKTDPMEGLMSAEHALAYPVRWVKTRKFIELTGESKGSIDGHINNDDWQEGEIWLLGTDGQRRFNLPEYDRWVENSRQASRRKKAQSKSGLSGVSTVNPRTAGSGKRSSSPPLRLTLRERLGSERKSSQR